MENPFSKHHKEGEDYNFKSAYYHILADALTSILAIGAILMGKYLHIVYLPVIPHLNFPDRESSDRWAADPLPDPVAPKGSSLS